MQWDALSIAHAILMETAVVSALMVSVFYYVWLVGAQGDTISHDADSFMKHAGASTHTDACVCACLSCHMPCALQQMHAILHVMCSLVDSLFVHAATESTPETQPVCLLDGHNFPSQYFDCRQPGRCPGTDSTYPLTDCLISLHGKHATDYMQCGGIVRMSFSVRVH